MKSTDRPDPGTAPSNEVRQMTCAEWAAIGEDAKHVEDGRYFVLVPDARGTRVVEIHFTDRRPRRVATRRQTA